MTRLNVHLYRDSFNTPWGFRLQGGKDLNQPLTVQRVFSNSPAERELQRGDNILSINTRDTSDLTHKQAQDYIKHGGGQIQLVIHRPPPGTYVAPLSPPIVTPRPRAPSLQSPSYYSSQPASVQYNQRPNYNTMNGDPYYGYRPDNPSQQTRYQSKPTYLQIQVNPPSHQKQQQQYHSHYQPHQNQPQQYYLQQQQQQQEQHHQPARHRSSWSQPPVTPTTPPPPWASQQMAPKRVTKLSQLGRGGQTYGTDYATLPRSSSAQYGATVHRPRPSFEPDEEREPELPLASGPVPRVCSRRNLGGGGQTFGTAYGQSATLPRRHEAGRRSSQPPSFHSSGGYVYSPTKVSPSPYGGPQQFGTDYSPKGYGQTPAQRYEPHSEKGIMLSR
ncbi:PDZ and LIM domain protein 3 [Plakobranchus ocellatus]|uniref:PDZ and LIM domain protein 3 n=1 Tax=Plakobranchus ocellatus TaxID=259542 RepID=A0AAV3YHW5_9GAST|nr:PDZ and LIM domain protein 3 [Plakobranchus ocellatus]